MRRQDARRDRAHPPLRAVADDGIAHFSARGETDPYPGVARASVGLRCGLHNQARPRGPVPGARDPKKVAAALQRFELAAQNFNADRETPASCRQTLAALRPACRQNPPAGHRRHPRSKPMTAFANQAAVAIHDAELYELATVDRLTAQELSPSTIRNTLLPVRAIYRRAQTRGEVALNPTLKLSLPAVRGRRDARRGRDEFRLDRGAGARRVAADERADGIR